MDKKNNFQKVTLTKFEGECAVLKLNSGEEIKWQKSKLPDNLKIGDVFYLIAQANLLSEEKNQQQIAARLLEEILNGNEEKEKS